MRNLYDKINEGGYNALIKITELSSFEAVKNKYLIEIENIVRFINNCFNIDSPKITDKTIIDNKRILPEQ